MNLNKKEFTISLLLEIFYTLFAYLITILASLRLVSFVPEVLTGPKIPLWQTLVAFAIGTIFILIALKYFRRGIFFHIFFSFALFLGIQLIFSAILPFIFSLIIALVLIVLRYAYPRVWIQNLVLTIGLSGLAVSLGLNIHWITVLALLGILSLYDIIAVYKTKHMVKMAEGLIARKVFPALIVPGDLSTLKTELTKVEKGKGFMFLGSGDLAFPLLFCISVLPTGLSKTIACAIGGLIGIIMSFLIFNLQKKRKSLPALPPIVLCSILGFLVGYLFF